MSDTPQGPGWWVASDGRYYPPEQHPNNQAPPTQLPAQPLTAQQPTAHWPPTYQPPGPSTGPQPPQFAGAQQGAWQTGGWQTPAAQVYTSAPRRTSAAVGSMFTAGLVGAAVVLIGALLPWVSVATPFGTISVAGTEGDGVLTLIAAVIAAAVLLFGRGRRGAAIAAAIIGVLVTLVGVYDLANVADVAAEASNEFARASTGIGLWLTVIGGIALTACAVVGAARR